VTRLHLVDGTYELFRAHYAPRPEHRAPGGWDAKATVGVAASLLALLNDADEAVTHIAVAFDNPIRSFRNDLFPDYKSDEGVPPELRSQFDTVETAVRALGIAVWSMREFEADDGLASGARRFAAEVDQVRIMTPDKDLGQCLQGDRVVMVDRRLNKVTDEAAFRARRGFGPRSMPDYLALTGDTADGIPGLAGFGDKSASLVIAQKSGMPGSVTRRIGASARMRWAAACQPSERKRFRKPGPATSTRSSRSPSRAPSSAPTCPATSRGGAPTTGASSIAAFVA